MRHRGEGPNITIGPETNQLLNNILQGSAIQRKLYKNILFQKEEGIGDSFLPLAVAHQTYTFCHVNKFKFLYMLIDNNCMICSYHVIDNRKKPCFENFNHRTYLTNMASILQNLNILLVEKSASRVDLKKDYTTMCQL